MGSRGLLIAFEGVDGAGKTSQVDRMRTVVSERGWDVRVLREPGGTPLGEKLRAVLLSGDPAAHDAWIEAMLFMASRRRLVLDEIGPALRRGHAVLLDRSFVSTWVYQGVVGGIDLDFLEELSRRVHGDAWPDRVLVLDIGDAEAARRRDRRGGVDGFESRGADYLCRVRDGFRSVAARRPELVRLVDGDGSEDEVARRCLDAVRDLLETQA